MRHCRKCLPSIIVRALCSDTFCSSMLGAEAFHASTKAMPAGVGRITKCPELTASIRMHSSLCQQASLGDVEPPHGHQPCAAVMLVCHDPKLGLRSKISLPMPATACCNINQRFTAYVATQTARRHRPPLGQ